ncbi:hypothetical protein VSH64_24815 [Amycolatopsis rhabdoformis]|uniref:Uncharacterized protein n=1 Tax=Amycolatopsis rhabdoformis TaxID=1448059 RepID=A0ABZ1HUS9_9PSEU|nr:hypothetical protein [Amycolatopsis rhabdoformis]WSE26100.1 hypothetical protein VSH64_24815 [Amycolatopsis rhabdoformis]
MVAQQPIERPKSVDPLVNRLDDLQRQIDALSRQSKYPFVIGHNGEQDFAVVPDLNDPDGNAKVVIGNGAGGVVLETFYSTVFGGKAARMVDLDGIVMWAHDELAGYGLSHPSMNLPTGPAFYGFGTETIANGVETGIGQGINFAYNPALRVTGLVRPTAATTWNYRWKVDYNGGTVFSDLTNGVTGAQNCSATLLLPASAMAHQIAMTLLVTNTGGAQNFFYGHFRGYGVSMAQYNVDNGL